MLSRGLLRCRRGVNAVTPMRRPHSWRTRKFSSSSSTASPAPSPQSPSSILGTITTELDRLSPRFEIQPSELTIIQDPSDFYKALKAKILTAKRRIYLSTLYVGKTEHELISTLRAALLANPTLRVSILTDALRGTRETPSPSCASLLSPLVAEFGPARVEVRMFHTPNLVGARKRLLPRRINEGWGLQHMKLYGFDDEVLLSGANLSADYFSDRQDRCHAFASAEVAEFYARVHAAVCALSFAVVSSGGEAGYTLEWPESNGCPSPLEDSRAFKRHATATLAPLLRPPAGQTPTLPDDGGATTLVYPVLQLTPLLTPDTSTELPAMLAILRAISPPPVPAAPPAGAAPPASGGSSSSSSSSSSWTFTAGYFNPSPPISRALLSTSPVRGTVLTAHPHANGFHLSPGVSGMLPPAYTLLARRFLDRARRRGLARAIALREWRRGEVNTPAGWTYHAKGLWVEPGDEPGRAGEGPALTVVGSSNYTKRSYALDLEVGAVVVARDPGVRRALAAEVDNLMSHSRETSREELESGERRAGWRVRAAMWVVAVLGGAL